MTQVVKRTGTVPTTAGLPGHADYWPKVQRTVLGPNQTLWNLHIDLRALGIIVPPGAILDINFYTVPAGFNLYLAAAWGVTSFSQIILSTWRDNGVNFAGGDWSDNYSFTPNPAGMYVLQAGHVFSGHFENLGDMPTYVSAFISGVLQRV